MKSSHKNVVIGLMSGTSLDGIDLCACSFEKVNDTIKYKIIAAETVDYTSEWMNTLSNQQLSGQELIKTHHQLGDFLGEKIIKFIDKYSLQPDLKIGRAHV